MYGMTASQQREANYKKNRGDPGQWFQHRATYREPQPNPRVTSYGAGTAEKYKECESNEVLHNYKLQPEQDPVPVRLRDADGQRNADKFNYQDDKWFDFHGNHEFYPDKKPPRLGTEKAKQVKETNEQQRSSDWYGHRSDPNDLEAPPKPRLPTEKSLHNKERVRNTKVDWSEHPMKRQEEEVVGPSVPPRTKPQGMEYAMRSRGTANEWMEHKTVNEEGPAGEGGPYRCNSRQAAENWQRARGDDMKGCFDYSSGYTEPKRGPKAQGKAEEYLIRNQQGSASLWKQGHATEETSKPVHRTRPEAMGNAEKNKGSLGMWLDQGQNKDYSSPRPQARLPSNVAQNAAERNKGCMDDIVAKGEYPQAVYKKPLQPQPRGAGDPKAQNVASMNKGGAAKNVMSNTNLPPETPRGGRYISPQAEGNFQRNQGSVGSLFTSYGRLDLDDKPQPRLRPEAVGNAERYRGSDFFKVIQQDPPSQR